MANCPHLPDDQIGGVGLDAELKSRLQKPSIGEVDQDTGILDGHLHPCSGKNLLQFLAELTQILPKQRRALRHADLVFGHGAMHELTEA